MIKNCFILQGFPQIQAQVLERDAFFVMPLLIRNNRQLEPSQRKENLDIAKERVHVEVYFKTI